MHFPKLAKQYPNQTALITGANSGLGLELTKYLLNDGWTIFAFDLSISNIHTIGNEQLNYYQIDITNRELYTTLLTDILSENSIDILFNNAGVGEGSLIKDYSPKKWDWIIAINLKAVITGTYLLLPHFLEKNQGMIVNMASAAGYANLPKMSPYNVTKAGVIAFSETLSHELSKSKIKVKCFTPTFFQSNIMQHSKGDQATLSSAQDVISSAKYNSQKAAKIVLQNLTNKKEVIRFPFSAKGLYFLKKWVPNLFKWGIRKFLVKYLR